MRTILKWGACYLAGVGLGWTGPLLAVEPGAAANTVVVEPGPEDVHETDMPQLFRRRCADDADCPGQNKYCRTRNGECDADHGLCYHQPQNCPGTDNPVCGCDGITYLNPCVAASLGVSLAHHGACDPPPGKCCTELGECVEATEDECFGELCGILWGGPGSSCETDPPGVPACPQPPIVAQACCLPDEGGCIITTACQCEQMGGQPQDAGECAAAACPGGQVCGGFAWIPCDNPDEFCRLDDGECCCDRQGHCTQIPDACPDVYDPVCGCDGITYGNRCEAYAAEISVDHVGACRPGRCCLETGDCIVVTQEECEAQCGVFHGEDQFCSATSCPMPPVVAQACCLPDGGCTVTTRCQCEQMGGSPQNVADCALATCGGSEVCGGILGIPCADAGDFCLLDDGECCCDFQGVCTPIPQGCPDVWDPVCGCDGVTYSNRCDAHAAGVSVEHEGVCGPARCCLESGACVVVTREACEEQCGVFYGDDPFCSPSSCPIPPVVAQACCLPGGECTVTTRCQCKRMGGSPVNAGDCSVVDCAGPEVCGGILGIPCSDTGDFCLLNDGECCCDFQGVCTSVPQACPDVWDPVCGCDGITYSNRCDAHAAGVSVEHEGTCGGVPCLDNADCQIFGSPLGYYCARPPGNCDGGGVCTLNPHACTAVYQPVCGCDGVTYSNACEAARAGVNVLSAGPCP